VATVLLRHQVLALSTYCALAKTRVANLLIPCANLFHT